MFGGCRRALTGFVRGNLSRIPCQQHYLSRTLAKSCTSSSVYLFASLKPHIPPCSQSVPFKSFHHAGRSFYCCARSPPGCLLCPRSLALLQTYLCLRTFLPRRKPTSNGNTLLILNPQAQRFYSSKDGVAKFTGELGSDVRFSPSRRIAVRTYGSGIKRQHDEAR